MAHSEESRGWLRGVARDERQMEKAELVLFRILAGSGVSRLVMRTRGRCVAPPPPAPRDASLLSVQRACPRKLRVP